MKKVLIKNISLRLPSKWGTTHLVFSDESGRDRLGRVIPFPVDPARLDKVLRLAEGGKGIKVPDGFSLLPDGSLCISVILEGRLPAFGELSPGEMAVPLERLFSMGLNHLSIDPCSWLLERGAGTSLVYWGDGLFKTFSSSPPEVAAGGFPGILSDLYMLAEAALCSRWYSDNSMKGILEGLRHGDYSDRIGAAEALGFEIPCFHEPPLFEETPEFCLLTGGDWRTRDATVNRLLCDAAGKGWACRALRKASGESGRPLPDVPPGTVTTSPEQLLANAFHGRPGMERMLVICDLSREQHDLISILGKLSRMIPSGLHILVATHDDSIFPEIEGFALPGESSAAEDIPLLEAPDAGDRSGAGPSWFGPRCRIAMTEGKEVEQEELSGMTLFKEGGWLHTVYTAGESKSREKAESLLRLGRYTEALAAVPKDCLNLRGEILLALGDYSGATKLLGEGEPLLLSRALKGTGRIQEALAVLKGSDDPAHLPELADLYDLSGEPARALPLMLESLEKTQGTEKVEILCALRNLQTRLGMYPEALQHGEMAISLAGNASSIPLLVKSLQERGRTLTVLGRWTEAMKDFHTAVTLHDGNALFAKRPPHIDLFDLQLRMGSLREARTTFRKLGRLLEGGGVPARQMYMMLKALRGVLLGEGTDAIPAALKAEELASKHGMELYAGISTLYAGRLYLQAGKRERGVNLLERARARGHLLGDRHLELLAEIELLVQEVREGRKPVETRCYSGELVEERLIMNIIHGREADSSFEDLLELPSPLTACRLADVCGAPLSPGIRERLHKARELLMEQLSGDERESYKKTFTSPWNSSSCSELLQPDSVKALGIISRWLFEYGEGMSGLDALASVLGLEKIALEDFKDAIRVPGDWPMYLRGEKAAILAPLLVTAAAVTACIPPWKETVVNSGLDATEIIGSSRAMKSVRYNVRRFADETVPVLITGETGTGKEVCARAIHRLGNRCKARFVPVDCGAIPDNLMESELFGAAAGAYTGITSSRTGLLQEADGGTLFLDEIGNLPLHMQVKLLRVLDTKTFRKLGENRERNVDIRVIAATNTDLAKEVARGSFRSDLYYRLAVVRIHIPPLRDRREDIEPLVVHFSGRMLTPGALEALNRMHWPGNVRELQNVVKRAAISSGDGIIRSCHVQPVETSVTESQPVTLKDAIRDHVRKTVDAAGGSRSLAAKMLDCDPKTVRKHLADQ
jgi:tetratricopeptide (TPR) repeat protein